MKINQKGFKATLQFGRLRKNVFIEKENKT
jgi:hypothetical protein